MSKEIDSKKYIEFVKQVTSPASTNIEDLTNRLEVLQLEGANIPRLLTAALGISAEGGELVEIVKKIFLQGKPYTEENIIHMKKEAGDILWYLAQLCMALDTDFDELMEINYQKLSARYPEGAFDVYKSENRKQWDI